MPTAIKPVAMIDKRDLDHEGMVEVRALIVCDIETAKRLTLNLALDLNQEEIEYVCQQVYHEKVTGC
jgi:hypothetical protein